jgi:phage-related protein
LGTIRIDFYETEDGKCPVEDFIKSLDKKMYAKVLRTLDLLETNGSELREPHSAPLGDGIFELRIKQGSDISRVLYFYFIGNKAILTNGFIKKTQKTPPVGIALAKKYKADYERRYLNEQIL